MKHVMLDCYGANDRQLNDINLLNELLNCLENIGTSNDNLEDCIKNYNIKF